MQEEAVDEEEEEEVEGGHGVESDEIGQNTGPSQSDPGDLFREWISLLTSTLNFLHVIF